MRGGEVTERAGGASPDAAADVPSLFEQTLEIDTPERVPIRHELAGIGSRFAAGTLDVAILGLVLLGLLIVLALVLDVSMGAIQEGWRAVTLAAYGVALAVVWLYYVGFELLWDGQTPGKRAMRLRVISEDGGPAPAAAIVVRNVLRIVDMLPLVLVHVLGGIVMFVSGRSKRVGDYAAGTVVVQEREVELSLDRLSRGVLDELGGDALSGEDRARVKRFVARRRELRDVRRAVVASLLADELRPRYDLPPIDAESMLVMLAAGRPLSSVRAAAGPALRPPVEPTADDDVPGADEARSAAADDAPRRDVADHGGGNATEDESPGGPRAPGGYDAPRDEVS